MSNKFVNYEDSKLPPIAIDLIMKYCLWEYYQIREQDEKRNTTSIRKQLKIQQKKRDTNTLNRPSHICTYFENNGIEYKLDISEYDKLIRHYNKMYDTRDFLQWEETDTEDELKNEEENQLFWQLNCHIEGIDQYFTFRHEADLDCFG